MDNHNYYNGNNNNSHATNPYGIKIRGLSALLALLMCFSLFTGCDKDKKSTSATTTKAATSLQTTAKSAKGTATESSASTTAASTKTTTKKSGTTTKATNKNASTASTTTKPVSLPQTASNTSSGLSNKPSIVDNAATPEALANVDPATAAAYSYDVTASVSESQYAPNDLSLYEPVAHADFASHIYNCWNSFRVVDNVKIERSLYEEYLNYCSLPVKDTIGAINCHGFQCSYYDDGTYIYLSVQWIYYINASQYNACKSAAQTLLNSISGDKMTKIRGVHDLLGKNNTYQVNVDGAYNCLINHTSDCDGYAAAFKICMDLLGVPCKAFTTSSHIFNMVQLTDGKWYVIDVTYDDQTNSGIVITNFYLRGSANYTSYPVLANMLSSTDYDPNCTTCDRTILITDKSKFYQFTGLSDSIPYTLSRKGGIVVYGQETFIETK